MKKKLYIKLHPNYISWLITETDYKVIPITKDFVKNSELIFYNFNELKNRNNINGIVNEIVIEKPFLRLLGDNEKKLASDIIHNQRHFGALLFVLNYLFGFNITHISAKTARDTVYKKDISKDVQLSEVNALLKGIKSKEYNAVQLLCLHDLLTIKSYVENYLEK